MVVQNGPQALQLLVQMSEPRVMAGMNVSVAAGQAEQESALHPPCGAGQGLAVSSAQSTVGPDKNRTNTSSLPQWFPAVLWLFQRRDCAAKAAARERCIGSATGKPAKS